MEYDLKIRDLKLEEKQKELDQALKERDDFKVKLEKWSNASVLQNEVLNKQRYVSDKSWIDELAIRNKVVNQEKTKSSQPEIDRNKVIIEDWVDSDDEETDVSESQKETAFNSENSETSFENSPNHLIKDCNLHERTFKHTQTHKPKGTQGSRETRPVWNNIQRVNHSNFSRNSRYPHQRRSFIPSAVLTRDGLISTARPTMTQTVPSKSTANVRTYKEFTARSRVPQEYFHRSPSTTRTLHRPTKTQENVKSILGKRKDGNPEEDLKDYAIIDSGCSGSMTGDKDKLSDFKEFKGGYVAFGNDSKDKECLILSPKFKFVDEDLVILRAPRKNDVYSLDLKNIIPSGGITCLVAKATEDEAVLWHRRLGHVNFKNINKLVKGNLVRGLPSKTFKLDHSCLACRKGKQHRASCKKIEERTVREPLELLHMDLFGPVSVESINKKKYCLVVTDDCSKFRNKREYSIARTPQQNVLPEERIWTLIEAARTYVRQNLFYPIQFWARSNLLGKFDGKSEEDICWDYFINSKGFRVYNRVTRKVQDCLHVNFLENQEKQKGKRKENYADSKEQGISCDDVEDLDDQQFIVHTAQPMHPEERTADKEIPLSSAEQALHDELVSLMHQESLAKAHNDDQRIAFEEEKKRIALDKGKECVTVTFTITDPRKSLKPADDSWVEAMQEECFNSSCKRLGVMDLTRRQEGYRQEEGVDFDMDVKSAFLYGNITEEVYVKQPPGFEDPAHPNKVYRVVKALYGLHQAPRAWYERLSTFLLKHGYRRGAIDKTLFIKKDRRDIMLVQVYVDDIIFGSTKSSMVKDFEDLMQKEFKMSSMGELTFFLGLQVKQSNGGIFLSQDKYVKDILNKFDFRTIKPASTPIEAHKSLGKDEEGEDVDVHLYRSMIGCLMYLTASRPDIMFAVCLCARFQVTPKVSHLHAVKRIFRYLKHQPKLGLWYPKDSPFHLEAFSDSDYAGDNHDRRSTSGGCQYLGRRLVSWQCKKQTIVAISSTEAEYVAAASCCAQVLWMQNQLLDYGFNFMNTEIHIDNESTICIVKNPVFHSKTKHIQIRHHFIRDCYEQRLINVVKPTVEVFSSCLIQMFKFLRALMGNNLGQTLIAICRSSTNQKLFILDDSNSWDARDIFPLRITPLTPSMLEVVTTLAAEEEHSTSPHSRAASLLGYAHGTPTQCVYILRRTASVQGTASFHSSAVPHDSDAEFKVLIPYKHNVQEEDSAHPFFDDIVDKDAAVTPDLERNSDETEEVNIEEKSKDAYNVKSGETKNWIWRNSKYLLAGYIYSRTLNFEDEAGLSIPGPIQSQPQQPTQGTDTQGTDPKDKGKGILVEEPKKKKMTLQQIRALETTNDEEKENQMMSFLKGQGYKNLQKLKLSTDERNCMTSTEHLLKTPSKTLFQWIQRNDRDDVEGRDAKRLLGKGKATIAVRTSHIQDSLSCEQKTFDELRNYLLDGRL
ncbi:putative ribonuclease H-like domain-containing protein [Tanacetum coccineum]